MDQLSPWVRYVSSRTSLGIQWLRNHLPMQGTWVLSLVWEDPTRCRGVTQSSKLLSPHSRARELQLLSLLVAMTEAHAPRACALQQERPPQGEAHALQERRTPFSTTGESPPAATKTQCNQDIKAIFFLKKRNVSSIVMAHSQNLHFWSPVSFTSLFRIKLTFQLPIDP